MNWDRTRRPYVLGLRAGDVVEVRSAKEILATLDREGTIDALPFMPEMLKYCGQRFTVHRRSHKTCDTIGWGIRRMKDTVHLDGVRCDGGAHGGCQAACLLYWNEAWLRRVGDDGDGAAAHRASDRGGSEHVGHGGDADDSALVESDLVRLTTAPPGSTDHSDVSYRCQATDLQKFSVAIAWWDPRQYLWDLTSRNVSPMTMLRGVALAMWNMVLRRLGRDPVPRIRGSCERTPRATLDLVPGERVRVKSRRAIVATLDKNRRNRGLSFDFEMVPYCGRTLSVERRVEKIINEKTGKMMHLPNDCVVLTGVTCSGAMSRDRLFCPRSIQPYWREIWLERPTESPDSAGR